MHSKNMSLTEQVLKGIKEIAKCPLYIHLWSCYSGSANKAARKLDNNSILVTHVESKSSSSTQLSDYAMRASLERYLKEKDLTPYQQFIRDFQENFAAATFNKIWANGATKKFKSSRMLKKNKMADVLKTLSAENDLTKPCNDFFVKEAERFKGMFKYANITNAVNFVSKL
ncbi:MAG: hypothetical protein LN568_00455 [Rickettsia endosymbiont of Pseudomimeciton antennatum]|nr:hypothetical protein [Rickettsia endosymbiont of Pseudomimeciton antennatum]